MSDTNNDTNNNINNNINNNTNNNTNNDTNNYTNNDIIIDNLEKFLLQDLTNNTMISTNNIMDINNNIDKTNKIILDTSASDFLDDDDLELISLQINGNKHINLKNSNDSDMEVNSETDVLDSDISSSDGLFSSEFKTIITQLTLVTEQLTLMSKSMTVLSESINKLIESDINKTNEMQITKQKIDKITTLLYEIKNKDDAIYNEINYSSC